MVEATKTRVLKTGGVLLFALVIVSCGGNGQTPTVTVSPATQTVIVNGNTLFTASVSGATSQSVNWQICLPPPKSGLQPVNCGANNLGLITPVAGTTTAVYTAPATIPTPNVFDVVAFSASSPTVFGAAQVSVSTGVSIQLSPTSATVQQLQSVIFTATVKGSANTAVSWALNGNTISGGNPQFGVLTPSSNNTAVYTAPGAAPPSSVTVSATSVADPTQSVMADVSVVAPADPTVTSLSPSMAAEGSVQLDVYLNGSGFMTNDTVFAGTGASKAPVTTFFISTTLLRATIPANFFQQSGFLPLQVQRAGNISSQPLNLSVQPVRPSVLSSVPSSTGVTTGAANINVSGGFYVPNNTQASFNGLSSAGGVLTNIVNSRQLMVTVPQSALGTAGLYPLFVQNLDVPAGSSAMASTNLAVEPAATSIPTAPIATIGVGASPSAIAVDQALGIALVANSGDGSVSVIDLVSNSVVRTITNVATSPSGIAVDDMLTPNVAVVVDSANDAVVPINLATFAVLPAVSLPVNSVNPTPPVAIGINPVSHRGIVASQQTDAATVLNISISAGSPVVTVSQQVSNPLSGGPFSTGISPSIAIDPQLNWAIIAPGGGGGIVGVIDLGSAANSFFPSGRNAQVLATLAFTSGITVLSPTGVGLNPVTHTAIFTDPNSSQVVIYDLLNNSVTNAKFAQSGTGYFGAGGSMTSNLGVVVNENSNVAAIMDLSTGNILQSGVALGNLPQAVAVDPATNRAFVVNKADGTASVLSLGPVRSLHIVNSNPVMTLGSQASAQLILNGFGFVNGTSQVLLDDTVLPPADVTVVSSRQIVATVPSTLLGAARRFSVTVQNPGGGANLLSNEVDFSVLQSVPVGLGPLGVAVDSDRDLAVVSNNADSTVSLVDLVHGITLAPSPIAVGTGPVGVAVIPRLGLALVADSISNQVSIVDETGINAPATATNCVGGQQCSQPMGVAINGDTGTGVIANFVASQVSTTNPTNPSTPMSYYSTVFMTVSNPAVQTALAAPLDQGPIAVAVDPNLNLAGIATTVGTTASPGFLDIADLIGTISTKASGFTRPFGVAFDPLNLVFLVADRGANNIVFVDPGNNTFQATTINAGVDPTSLDYDYQTGTLVTANNSSNSISLLNYSCPPLPNSGCPTPTVQRILGLSGSQEFSVAVDAKLNLIVLADQTENRVLLVPLP